MAKVMAEKMAKERARDTDDKKLASMKRVREENKKKGPKYKGQERKAIENRKGGEKGKKEEGTERDAGLQGNPKIPKGGILINQKASISTTS